MKISEAWLKEWVELKTENSEAESIWPSYLDKLTMAGLEIEAYTPVAADFSGIVIGEIMAVQQHPKAEKLSICEVNIGEEETLDIITIATNVRAGLKVPVALEGAVLQGKTVQAALVKEVPSQGLFCSTKDLGIGDNAEQVLELPAQAALGDDVHHYLQLNDRCIEINITPNRGDCLSVQGLARETAVLNHTYFTAPQHLEIAPTMDAHLPIKMAASAACPRYVGRIIQGINTQARTPIWMQEKLRRSGLRSIHPVVDVTNYVMLEWGQPMHAFDFDTLNGGITIRYAHPDEKIILLDDSTRELSSVDLIIADDKYPLALAGVMGGKLSSVTETTQNLFLESAFFMPEAVAQTARRHSMVTDSSQRFERGVDPELAEKAIERATELLLSIVGGKVGPVLEELSVEHFPKLAIIELRKARIEKLLGCDLAEDRVEAILSSLGMLCLEQPHGWQVQVPSYRFDLRIEEDLIEELARIYGYNEIPARIPLATLNIRPQLQAEVTTARIREALVDRGYYEAISYSFIAPKMQAWFNPDIKPIELVNPISPELSVMRGSIWPGLLEALRYNRNRQIDRARFFEVGPRYFWQDSETAGQEIVVAGLIAGSVEAQQWGHAKEPVDFFTAKGDLEALFQLGHTRAAFTFSPAEQAGLHPHQCAEIKKDGKVVGILASLHPALAQELDLADLPVYLFEISLKALTEGILPQFLPLSRFQATKRDLAIVLDADIPAEQVVQRIAKKVSDLIQSVQIFDVYQGDKMPVGKKSIALSLILQHSSRTLIDEEVNQLVEQVVGILKQEFQAVLR